MKRWKTALLWGGGLSVAGGLGLFFGLAAGVARIEGEVKDVLAAGIGAFVTVAGAAVLQALSAKAAARQSEDEIRVRRATVHELVLRLNAAAAYLANAHEEASARQVRPLAAASEQAIEVLAAWHPVSLFSPYDQLGSVRALTALVEIDSICRRLERIEERTEGVRERLRPQPGDGLARRLTNGEGHDHTWKLVSAGNELQRACGTALRELADRAGVPRLGA